MRTKSRSGFTVLELLVSFVIIIIVCGTLFSACGGVTGVNTEAVHQANEYASGLGLNIKGVQCANWDSDGDGYVSCTLAFADSDGSIHPMAIECAAGFNMTGWMNDGCRMPKAVVRGFFGG